MDKAILHRIEALEKKSPHGITVLARSFAAGEERTIPLRELIADFEGWELVKFVDGNDLGEFDEYLAEFRRYVNEQEH